MSASNHESLTTWPALVGDRPWPDHIAVERGIWGKVHGRDDDFRWILRSEGFDRSELPRLLYAGWGQRSAATFSWWSGDAFHAAVHGYPSLATDGSGRSGFLEQEFLTWQRPPETPALLGLIALAPRLEEAGGGIGLEDHQNGDWQDPDFFLEAPPPPPVPVPFDAIRETVERGLQQLAEKFDEDALSAFYCALLAGHRPAWLSAGDGLSAAALAALLLPLPRATAERLSVAGWLPATSFDGDELAETWDAVVSDLQSGPSLVPPEPDAATADQGRELARSVLARTPPGAPAPANARHAPEPSVRPLRLALWGPPQAGKTALLAQYYIETAERGDWDIFPTETSRAFIDEMRRTKILANRFPPATPVGKPQRVEYRVRHRSNGRQAVLDVEDRAGLDSQQLPPEMLERLRAADGLLLLFDLHDAGRLEADVALTLDGIHLASAAPGSQDPRPMAVCLSKADRLIETAEDLQRARRDPDGFLRPRLPRSLLATIDRYCARYRLFPVSAVGIDLCWGTVRRTTFYDERMTPRVCPGGEPINLREPFAWLFDSLAETG